MVIITMIIVNKNFKIKEILDKPAHVVEFYIFNINLVNYVYKSKFINVIYL